MRVTPTRPSVITDSYVPAANRFFARSIFHAFVGLALAGPAAAASVVVKDAAGRPIKDAVLAVVGDAPGPTQVATASIEQSGRRFIPTVTVVPVGSSISFPNHDTVRHHVYSFSAAKRFEIKLYIGTPAAPVVFDQPGIVTLGCNIHDRMLAWVVVVDSNVYAKTDGRGSAELNVPDGTHRLRIWHPGLGEGVAPIETVVAMRAKQPTQITLEP